MAENETIKERLILFIRHLNIGQGKFETRCGLANGYVNNIRRSITPEKLQQIARRYPELNAGWLMTGEGEMLRSRSPDCGDEAGDLTPSERQMIAEGLRDGRFRMVPLINIDSVGGILSENEITPSEQYIIRMMPFTEARDGDLAILESGSSMYPTIPPGSVLLIREVVDWQEYFGYGGLFVLCLKDGRRVTKVVLRHDTMPKKYVVCHSYNPDVADEELPRSMIRGVWKVIKYVTDFGW